MAQVLWNVVRKNSVFSNISDVEYLFCSQRNLLPSNWPWVGSAANLKKRKKKPTYLSSGCMWEFTTQPGEIYYKISIWQDSSLVVSGQSGLSPSPAPESYNWQKKPLVKVLVQENQSLSDPSHLEDCFFKSLDNGVQLFILCWSKTRQGHNLGFCSDYFFDWIYQLEQASGGSGIICF